MGTPYDLSYDHFCVFVDLYKIITFVKMVITRVENGSPDMIPVAFDKKFDEKKDEIPPRDL